MLLDKTKLVQNTVLTLFWVWCTFGFIAEEVAPFLESLRSGIFFLVDMALLGIGLVVLKDRKDKFFVLSFLAITYWITCIHCGYDTLFYFNGTREFVYLLWIIPILRYIYNSRQADEFVKRFDKHLFIFLIIQAFCVTFQFLKYGANDHGGGSMGNGFSGVVSMMIYLISFYLMKKQMDPDNYISSLINNKWLIILLFPTMLNETKISFILLAMYFILLLPINRQSLMKLLILSPVMCILMVVVFNIYMSVTDSQFDITSEGFLEAYFYAEENDDIVNWVTVLHERGEDLAIDGTNDIPRFTKYIMIPELTDYYTGHSITGFGVGQFKGGTMIDSSKFYKENEYLLRGSIPYGFHAFIQIGFFAIIYFIWLWFRLASLKTSPNIERGIVLFIIVMTLIVMLYNDFFRYGPICIAFFYIYTQALRWKPNENKPSLAS
jgi:hypothetical protein